MLGGPRGVHRFPLKCPRLLISPQRKQGRVRKMDGVRNETAACQRLSKVSLLKSVSDGGLGGRRMVGWGGVGGWMKPSNNGYISKRGG